MLNRSSLLAAAVAVAIAAGPAAADPRDEPRTDGARWSIGLAGGALVPVRHMRDGYQDALIAGVRVGVRSRIGLGAQVALDYSPLPRRARAGESYETVYGTAAVVPTWTFGRGTVRVQLGAGGGVAVERTTGAETIAEVTPAAMGLLALELHVTPGGGLVVLGGATRTLGERPYEYGWAMAGLVLEF